MELIINSLLSFTENMGYLGIFLLMTIESSFIPFPSEIVIPPAAFLAAQGKMNIFLVIFFGIFGSLVGAIINYFLAKCLGRKIIYSIVNKPFAKYLFLNSDKIMKAENHFKQYGAISTFFGRLVPGIRQLISIPAGFSKMNFISFIFYTFLGAGFWVLILALLGFYFGENEELLTSYYNEISYGFIIIVVILIFGFLTKKYLTGSKIK